jgi:hypothetical protein
MNNNKSYNGPCHWGKCHAEAKHVLKVNDFWTSRFDQVTSDMIDLCDAHVEIVRQVIEAIRR